MSRDMQAPAGLTELGPLRPSWVEYLHHQFQAELLYIRAQYRPFLTYDPALTVHFADPTETYPAQGVHLHTVTWSGYPREIEIRERDAARTGTRPEGPLDTGYAEQTLFTSGGNEVRLAYRAQDEYLEWHVEHDESGRMRRITFVCEPPDYWSCFADGYPAPYFGLVKARRPARTPAGRLHDVVAYYNAHVGPAVTAQDLVFRENLFLDPDGKALAFREGDYNPWNAWNTRHGIVHMSHPANTVYQAIQIAGDSSLLRTDRMGRLLHGAKSLLCCGAYGGINRSSDPAIGAAVNELVHAGYHVTMADPVGVYISHLEDDGWTKPDGEPLPPTFWRVERVAAGIPGRPGSARTVRAVYEVPAGETYRAGGERRPMTLSDIRIGGKSLTHARQVAEAVRLALTLAAWTMTGRRPAPIGCHPGTRCWARRDGSEHLELRGSGYPNPAPDPTRDEVDAFPEVSASSDMRLKYLIDLGRRSGFTGDRDWREMWPDNAEPQP
jgi:hypothetical protein